jgi:DNA-binding transcriptional ArsR family regulator
MQLSDITTTGQLFSEEARVRILCLLSEFKEACLADLNQVLGYETQKTHRHIKYIESAGYLSSIRYAQWMYYSLPTSIPDYMAVMIEQAMRTRQVQEDIAAYSSLLRQGDLAASTKAREMAEAK